LISIKTGEDERRQSDRAARKRNPKCKIIKAGVSSGEKRCGCEEWKAEGKEPEQRGRTIGLGRGRTEAKTLGSTARKRNRGNWKKDEAEETERFEEAEGRRPEEAGKRRANYNRAAQRKLRIKALKIDMDGGSRGR